MALTKPSRHRRQSAPGRIAIHFHLETTTADALDAWVEELRARGALGSSGLTRASLIRDLLARAVAEKRA